MTPTIFPTTRSLLNYHPGQYLHRLRWRGRTHSNIENTTSRRLRTFGLRFSFLPDEDPYHPVSLLTGARFFMAVIVVCHCREVQMSGSEPFAMVAAACWTLVRCCRCGAQAHRCVEARFRATGCKRQHTRRGLEQATFLCIKEET